MLAFTGVTVAEPALGRRGVFPLRPALVAAVALLVGVVALGLLVEQGLSRAEDEADAFADEELPARRPPCSGRVTVPAIAGEIHRDRTRVSTSSG